MALDHADRIERLCVLNVIPTAERFDRLDADSALEYWPFLLLAQPAPFAEQLITASAQDIVRHLLDTWVAAPARSSRAPRASWCGPPESHRRGRDGYQALCVVRGPCGAHRGGVPRR